VGKAAHPATPTLDARAGLPFPAPCRRSLERGKPGAVSLAKVGGKPKAKGKSPDRTLRRLLAMDLQVLPFTWEAGTLDPLAWPLGHRACWAAGKVRRLLVLTGNRSWLSAGR